MELKIKGKYTYHIQIPTMFRTYKTSYTNHNLITTNGLNFLVKQWNNEDGEITEIILGTSNETPNIHDTIDTFNNPYRFNVDCHTDDNKLIMSTTNLSGEHLNNTREIGVIADTTTQVEDDETHEMTTQNTKILVSRSVHPIISIPTTSLISLEYEYILTSLNDDECE